MVKVEIVDRPGSMASSIPIVEAPTPHTAQTTSDTGYKRHLYMKDPDAEKDIAGYSQKLALIVNDPVAQSVCYGMIVQAKLALWKVLDARLLVEQARVTAEGNMRHELDVLLGCAHIANRDF